VAGELLVTIKLVAEITFVLGGVVTILLLVAEAKIDKEERGPKQSWTA
jgi:hypothetical protein